MVRKGWDVWFGRGSRYVQILRSANCADYANVRHLVAFFILLNQTIHDLLQPPTPLGSIHAELCRQLALKEGLAGPAQTVVKFSNAQLEPPSAVQIVVQP